MYRFCPIGPILYLSDTTQRSSHAANNFASFIAHFRSRFRSIFYLLSHTRVSLAAERCAQQIQQVSIMNDSCSWISIGKHSTLFLHASRLFRLFRVTYNALKAHMEYHFRSLARSRNTDVPLVSPLAALSRDMRRIRKGERADVEERSASRGKRRGTTRASHRKSMRFRDRDIFSRRSCRQKIYLEVRRSQEFKSTRETKGIA